LKVLFMGTPAFAVPSLEALLASRHQVAAVVTRPDRPAGRGRGVKPPPVKSVADGNHVPVLQPEGVRAPAFIEEIRSLGVDVLVVVAFGRILPRNLLEAVPLGGINLHASLLPRYRGAAPIAWAVARGETVTGVTTMKMAERLDAGDILLQRSTAIEPDETTGMLEGRLSEMGAALLVETLDAVDEGNMALLPQREEEATFAPILKKEDGRIDWSLPAEAIARRVRAFDPWPVAFTGSAKGSLRVWRAREASGEDDSAPAGTLEPGLVVAAGAGGVHVLCEGGTRLELLEVQPEGRRRMAAPEAAAGRYFKMGEKLG
jgi:methionyl-tRNA formyltransferase